MWEIPYISVIYKISVEYVSVYAIPLQYFFKHGNAFFRKGLVLKTPADCVFSPGELDTSNNKTTAKGR